jgi:acyl-CoA synthetase (AMP-forming)/AMP-acid ligase II
MSRAETLWSAWEKTVRAAPRRIAYIDAPSGRRWTAAELTDLATARVNELRDFRPGARIAFRLPNGIEWLALFLATQRARLAAMPLDAGLPDDGARALARQLGAHGLVLQEKIERRPNPGRIADRATCCVKVTSGSSGAAQAVNCRPAHLIADGRNVCRTMGIRPGDLNFASIPLGHSYGLGNLVLPLIDQGTAIVGAAAFVPRQLVEWLRTYRVTVLPSVPAIFRVLAQLPGRGKAGPLRTAISAGAMLPPETAAAFAQRFGVRIHNFYGSSETGGICYDRTGSAALTGRSVGKPLEGVRVTLVRGMVTVHSAAVAARSGRRSLPDLGQWNARGELVLLGRRGRGANIGGKKVHPLEIERVLRALSGVTDAQVWLNRSGGRDVIVAAVETARTTAEIEAALARKLPAWALPKGLLVAAQLPRTERGKLDAAALRRLALPPG